MFISVKEAMELTGMSSTTIYRLCNKRINTLYVRREDNKFLIDKEFILATFPPDIVSINQDVEHEVNVPVIIPEMEVIKVEKSDKDNSVFIIENTIEKPKPALKIETTEISENLPASKEYQASEILETNEMDDALQLIASSQNSEIQSNEIENINLKGPTEILEQPITAKVKTFNWEALVGISVSLVLVCLLIYLIYLDVK